jgi:hypothetical protein
MRILGPNVAAAILIALVSQHLKKTNDRVQHQMEKNKFTELPILHHLAAGIKSYCMEL